jgi:Flp pilus assembly protein TadG
MKIFDQTNDRRAVAALEFALVLPVLLLLAGADLTIWFLKFRLDNNASSVGNIVSSAATLSASAFPGSYCAATSASLNHFAIAYRVASPLTVCGSNGATIIRHPAIARFTADRQGATALLIALMIVALIGAIGVAVEGTRLVMVQSRLKTAVDAAALVAARDISLADGATNARGLFWANFGRSAANSTLGFMGTTITNNLAVTPVSADTVSVRAEGLFPTTFMNVFGIHNIAIASSSQATRAATGLELALVLDNTGSMAGWPIQSVVTSATDLVNILYGNGSADTEPNIWVFVVPFSAEVNIRAASFNIGHWLKPGSLTSSQYMNTTWMGCVMARYDTVDADTGLTNDFTDVTPDVAPFTPFLYPSTYGLYVHTVNGTPVYYGDNDWTPTHITEATPANSAVGPNLGCPQNGHGIGLPILPETTSPATVLGTISKMVANYRGGTFISTTVAYRPYTALTRNILSLSLRHSTKCAILIHCATVVLDAVFTIPVPAWVQPGICIRPATGSE